MLSGLQSRTRIIVRMVALKWELRSALLGIHQLTPHSFTTSNGVGLALASGSALVIGLGVSEDTCRPRRGVCGHELAVLGKAEKSLVTVVVTTEGGDDALVKMIEEPLFIVGGLGL